MNQSPRHHTLPLLVAVLTLGAGVTARGEDRADALRAAQQAYSQLRYEQALELYQRAWHDGDNGPERGAEILRGLAQSAAILGREEIAIGAYQKLLTLQPEFRYGDLDPPLFRRAFDRAQSALGREPLLNLEVSSAAGGTGVLVGITHNRGDLASTVVVRFVDGAGRDQVQVRPSSDDLRFSSSMSGPLTAHVSCLDRAGNTVAHLVVDLRRPLTPAQGAEGQKGSAPAGTEEAVVTASSSSPGRDAGDSADPPRPWYSRRYVWLGAAALVATGVGASVGLASLSTQRRFDDQRADPEAYQFEEVRATRDRLRTQSTVANVCFGIGAVLATGALVDLVFLQPDGGARVRKTSGQVMPTSGGLAIGLSRDF